MNLCEIMLGLCCAVVAELVELSRSSPKPTLHIPLFHVQKRVRSHTLNSQICLPNNFRQASYRFARVDPIPPKFYEVNLMLALRTVIHRLPNEYTHESR
ncbi:hypothetical protein CPB84DRAFT_1791339 [Gymnopilus junonius]|uniref:Secreted protein n=1 Tax=Gymnopilus junonius TaxID=109634 RepID=A0A9P5NF80_GYMJU|nr:hypothetical protein CPB84DRAFT_1791339 [Gymnopilus junonius]